MLSDLLMRMYKGLAEFLGWIVLLGAAAAGAIIGKDLGDWGPVVGLLSGALAGFLIDALLLPPLLILFKIHDRLDEITARE